MVGFYLAFTQLLDQCMIDGREFLKPKSLYAIMASFIPLWYFLERFSWRVQVHIHQWAFFLFIFFHVNYPFSISFMFFSIPYYVSFAFDCWFVLIQPPPTRCLKIVCLFGKILFCLYCLTLYWYHLGQPFFHQYLLIYFFPFVELTCRCYFWIFLIRARAFAFLRNFTCCSFFICPSFLISLSCLVFLLIFLWEKTILWQTNFAPA